jgi:hypothetical protein
VVVVIVVVVVVIMIMIMVVVGGDRGGGDYSGPIVYTPRPPARPPYSVPVPKMHMKGLYENSVSLPEQTEGRKGERCER